MMLNIFETTYEEYYGIVTGQIERSIVTLLDINCNSLQVQNLARSFIEYDERSKLQPSNCWTRSLLLSPQQMV